MAEEMDLGALKAQLAADEKAEAAAAARAAATRALLSAEEAKAKAQPPAAAAATAAASAAGGGCCAATAHQHAHLGATGMPFSSAGRELALYQRAHGKAAAETFALRNHGSWEKFYDPDFHVFLKKDGDYLYGGRYHQLMAENAIPVPEGMYFHEAERKLVRIGTAHGGRLIGNVIVAADRLVSFTVEIFNVVGEESVAADGTKSAPSAPAMHKKLADTTRKHITDAAGGYHQSWGTYEFSTTEKVFNSLPKHAKWDNPYNQEPPMAPVSWAVLCQNQTPIWIRHKSSGVPFLDVTEEAREVTSLLNARSGTVWRARGEEGITLAHALDPDFSPYSAFIIRSSQTSLAARQLEGSAPLPQQQRMRSDKAPLMFSPYTPVTINSSATSLSDWFQRPPQSAAISVDGVELTNCCGYAYLMNTFKPAFDKAVTRGSSAAQYTLSMPYLFKLLTGQPMCTETSDGATVAVPLDEEDFSLSLEQFRSFFLHYKLNLTVLDNTGRVIPGVSVHFARGKLNGAIKSNTHSFIVYHNGHIFPVPEAQHHLLEQSVWDKDNSVKFNFKALSAMPEPKPLDIAPTSTFPLANKEEEPPSVWCSSVEALPTLTVLIEKPLKGGSSSSSSSSSAAAAVGGGGSASAAAAAAVRYHNYVRVVIPASESDVWSLLARVITESNYFPRVSLGEGNVITGLTMCVEGSPKPKGKPLKDWDCESVMVNISMPTRGTPVAPNDNEPTGSISTQDAFDALNQHTVALRNNLQQRVYLSNYSNSARQAFRLHPREGLSYGAAAAAAVPLYAEHDLNLAYTNHLYNITSVPVFNNFDEVEPFVLAPEPVSNSADSADNNDPIAPDLTHSIPTPPLTHKPAQALRDKHAFYLVKRLAPIDLLDPLHILLDQPYNLLTYDTWRTDVGGTPLCNLPIVETVGVLKPSLVVPFDCTGVMDKLWLDPRMERNDKKQLVNTHVGLLGKRKKNRSHTYYYTDKLVRDEKARQLGYGVSTFTKQLGDLKLYFLRQSSSSEMRNGFYPIHHMVKDADRRSAYRRLLLVGKPLVGIKTDALFFASDGTESTAKDTSFAARGQYSIKLVDDAPHSLPPRCRLRVCAFSAECTCPEVVTLFTPPTPVHLEVKNEWDEGELITLFKGTLSAPAAPAAAAAEDQWLSCQQCGMLDCYGSARQPDGSPASGWCGWEKGREHVFVAPIYCAVCGSNNWSYDVCDSPDGHSVGVAPTVTRTGGNLILVKGVVPGAGKTRALLNYCKDKRALFVCPYNSLCDDIQRCNCGHYCQRLYHQGLRSTAVCPGAGCTCEPMPFCDKEASVCLRAHKAVTVDTLLGYLFSPRVRQGGEEEAF
jgi:hypothetical protein